MGMLTDNEACEIILASDPFQSAGAPCWAKPAESIRVRGERARAEFVALIDQASRARVCERKTMPPPSDEVQFGLELETMLG